VEEGTLRFKYCCLPGSQEKCELVSHRRQLAALWLLFFGSAGVTYHMPPVLLPSIMKEFDSDQYQVAWLPAMFQLLKGLFSVPGGFALDWFGTANCFRAGILILVIASAIYPFSPQLWCLGVLQGIYGIAYDLCGIGPAIVFVTSWFEQQRALAIALMATGFSLAGVCCPPIVGSLVEHHGWRAASLVAPFLLFLVGLPCSLVLTDGPLRPPRRGRHFQAMGREEPGELDREDRDESGRLRPLPLNFWQSLRLGAVWHLAFLSFYELYVIIATINTLVLYLKTDVGMSVELCGMYTSIVFQASTVGKLVSGVAMDYRQTLTGVVSGLTLLVGTLLPLDFTNGCRSLTSSHSQLVAFAVVYGFGFGAAFAVLCAKPAKLFGKMPDFSKLQGFLMVFQVVGGFLGTLVTGKLRTLTGSYTTSFHVFVLMAFLALLHYIGLEASRSARLGH